MKYLISIGIFLAAFCLKAEQPASINSTVDFTFPYNEPNTALTNPTLYYCTNSVFNYYGFPPNFVNASNWSSGTSGIGYVSSPANGIAATILSDIQTNVIQPGLDVCFTITAQEFEIHAWDYANDYCDIYDEDDGSLTTFQMEQNGQPIWYQIQYPSKKTRHLRLYFESNINGAVPGVLFSGINVGQGDSIAADPSTQPGMMVQGDSYCQGWNPVTEHWFYDSYATLSGFLTNGGSFHVLGDGIGGSGYLANGQGTNYAARFSSDILPYANLFRFFVIQTSINDAGHTNDAAYFAAVTNMIGLAKTYLPNKEIAVLGIPYNAQDGQNNYDLDTNAMAAAQVMNVPFFDALAQNGGQGLFPANSPGYNWNTNYIGWDGVHPTQTGYQLLANFLNSEMQQTFSDYPGSQAAPTNQAGKTVTLSVANFGASGDATGFTVSCTSNSPVVSVVGGNTFGTSAIGKVIEVFGAGPQLQFSNDPPYQTTSYYGNNPNNGMIVTQQDIICLVTNVSEGTNLSLSIPCGWTMNAYCILGTNNAPAFQAAINSASNYIASGRATKAIVDIPSGTYLLASPQVLNPNYIEQDINGDGNHALTISSGGITFFGQSTNTVLMACGAGMDHPLNNTFPYGSLGFFNPMRDSIIYCAGPVSDSQAPLIFQNLTFDGGVPNGAQSYNYFTLYEGNGEGWDTSHHALVDWSALPAQMNQMKVFTNCVFQHWRGEMLICTTGDITNGFNDIADCTFYDGNATADNLYYGQHVHGCVFNQVEKAVEYYQANASLPSIFENNLMTNIAGNILVINGATTNANPAPYLIQNNTFYGTPNYADILFTPAENVTVLSNSFYGQAEGISFSSAGLQPSDGSAAMMSNIVIVANAFNNTFLPIITDGYPVVDVMASNNASASTYSFAMAGGGFKTNIVLAANKAPQVTLNSAKVQSGQYFVDEPSDQLGWFSYNDWTGQTNFMDYGNGRKHLILHTMPSSIFQIVTNSLIPPGASLEISNATASTIQIPGVMALAPTQDSMFAWNGSAWQQQSQVIGSSGAPQLAITLSNGNINVTWPTNAVGFTLQAVTNAVNPSWAPFPIAPIIANGLNVVTVPVSCQMTMFRLIGYQ